MIVPSYALGHTLGERLVLEGGGDDEGAEDFRALRPTATRVGKAKRIDDAKINTLTVMIMQVPCCMGLLNLAQQAASQAKRKVPVKYVVVGIQGQILKEEWA